MQFRISDCTAIIFIYLCFSSESAHSGLIKCICVPFTRCRAQFTAGHTVTQRTNGFSSSSTTPNRYFFDVSAESQSFHQLAHTSAGSPRTFTLQLEEAISSDVIGLKVAICCWTLALSRGLAFTSVVSFHLENRRGHGAGTGTGPRCRGS